MTRQASRKTMESRVSNLEAKFDEFKSSQEEFKNLQEKFQSTQDLILLQLQSILNRSNGGSFGESSKATLGNPHLQTHMNPNFARPDNGQNSNQQVPQPFLKMDFPRSRFNEGDDLLGWIYRAEHYFEFFSINDTKKVKLASFHMEGEAL